MGWLPCRSGWQQAQAAPVKAKTVPRPPCFGKIIEPALCEWPLRTIVHRRAGTLAAERPPAPRQKHSLYYDAALIRFSVAALGAVGRLASISQTSATAASPAAHMNALL